MREPKWQSPLAASPLEHGDGPHLQDEVGGSQPELCRASIEDQDEHDSLLVAALFIVGEVEVEAGAGAAQDAEAVASSCSSLRAASKSRSQPATLDTLPASYRS